ncbi:HET-domain-containing protein [Daldinia decipiens]|uniref:HET-domain-containing protein n=1 Tax=Daldinia decipiens TaxID=326647 RepID=UPI0020C427B4|nr:HET-domain-containing protein [Daldinia decipiens]KAI1661255.1 HET-domain-containing protein [Daldinia decipiens]
MIRLIHCGEWKLHEFDPGEVPNYAILSHRWFADASGNPEEVTYQDFQARLEGNQERHARSWAKVEKARDIAWGLNIQWIWIDSCCINNRDIPELSEAINSMYQWYAQSQVCIVYLSDVDRTELGPSSWFFRGWTLQELIAPSRVLFYNKLWEYCGSRNGYSIDDVYDMDTDLSNRIAMISRIDPQLLKLNDSNRIKRYLSSVPACQKMSWAAKRETTRKEDMAYCLIGIFGISRMHLGYGEGDKAFIRLQEEIIMQTSDPTLFAWVVKDINECNPDNILKTHDIEHIDSLFKFNQSLHGVFACHPREFDSANKVKPTQHAMYNDEITITSKGVKFIAALWGKGLDSPFTMPLYCYDEKPSSPLGIHMRWVGGSVYARTNITSVTYVSDEPVSIPSQDDIFVTHKIYHLQDCLSNLHQNSIRLPKTIYTHGLPNFGLLERIKVSPGFLWCEEHNLLMTYGTKFPLAFATYQMTQPYNGKVILIFGLDHAKKLWFSLVEPGSQLAPLRLETRRTYLDRIWRSASQKRHESIRFTVGPWEHEITGAHTCDVLNGQPIFHINLHGSNSIDLLAGDPIPLPTTNTLMRPQKWRQHDQVFLVETNRFLQSGQDSDMVDQTELYGQTTIDNVSRRRPDSPDNSPDNSPYRSAIAEALLGLIEL